MVVLGTTGVNFAAGMSGGIAYVWDPEKLFTKKCNTEMVELLPLTLSDQTDYVEFDDEQLVHDMVHKHYKYTKSDIAKKILDTWEAERHSFVKIMPSDYKKVLNATCKPKTRYLYHPLFAIFFEM